VLVPEDLRENRPPLAGGFAVHRDRVRTGAEAEVASSRRFVERTCPTENLRALAAEVPAQLSGEAAGAIPDPAGLRFAARGQGGGGGGGASIGDGRPTARRRIGEKG
jgi:hypothetical protein